MTSSPAGWDLDTRTGWKCLHWVWHFFRPGQPSACGKWDAIRLAGAPRKPLDAEPNRQLSEHVCADCQRTRAEEPR